MVVNYWIVFFVISILTAFTLVKLLGDDFSWKDRDNVITCIIWFPFTVGVVVCLLLNIFSSAVLEIRDNEEYCKRDYLFCYKDKNDELHIVVPFTNYLSNASNKEIKLSKVGYGEYKHNTYQDKYFPVGVFKRIDENPSCFFEEPPMFVKSRYSGSVVSVISYKTSYK